MDHIFDTNNAVIIAAAAKGLEQADKQALEFMTVSDFITFLGTPDAEEIVDAIFQPTELRYWKGETRLVWNTAYVPDGDMNVAIGPQVDHFERCFQSAMVVRGTSNKQVALNQGALNDAALEDAEQSQDEPFYEQLLPHRYEKLDGQTQVPIQMYQCMLPGLYRNVNVLWVLASGKNEVVFEALGSRAIIQVAYMEAATSQLRIFTLEIIAALAIRLPCTLFK